MICWPEKLVVKGLEFFKTRFSMHSNVYTHKTVKAVEYMICDALVLADPWIPVPNAKVRVCVIGVIFDCVIFGCNFWIVGGYSAAHNRRNFILTRRFAPRSLLDRRGDRP